MLRPSSQNKGAMGALDSQRKVCPTCVYWQTQLSDCHIGSHGRNVVLVGIFLLASSCVAAMWFSVMQRNPHSFTQNLPMIFFSYPILLVITLV